MSIVHGPIDEELLENAFCVFDLEVVAGRPVEW
jgi:hypothetical protein